MTAGLWCDFRVQSIFGSFVLKLMYSALNSCCNLCNRQVHRKKSYQMKHVRRVKLLIIFLSLSIISCQRIKSPLSNDSTIGTWEIISETNESLDSIYFISPTTGWMIGDSGSIKKSINGGYDWIDQKSGTKNRLRSIHFMDDKVGYATGDNKTLISTKDGGEIWKNIDVKSDSASIFSSIHSDNDNNIYFISNYGEIFCAENLSKDWHLKHSFNEWGYSYLNFRNNPVGFAMQFMGNILQKTIDDGNSWQLCHLPSPWSGSIFFLDEHNGWLTENWAPSSTMHDSVSIYMTNDGGETWDLQSSLPGLSSDNIIFVDIREGWISGITKIYYTFDSGKNWIIQFDSEDIGFIKNIFFVGRNNGWALTSQGKIIKYTGK